MNPLPLNVWSVVMLIACLVTIARLLTFRRGDSRHRHGIAWLSWGIVVVASAIAVKIAGGVRPPPGPVEALASAAWAVWLLIHRGNLAHVQRSAWRALTALRRGARS